ncbi:uncharacterized protein METZ01_LOCUS192566, partial [marine metagenome]
MNFKNTSEIKVPSQLINKIIGQNKAVSLIEKAAKQRRHILLIGEPGTGKSMLGQALSHLVPKEALKDILILPNSSDENTPLVRPIISGRGKELLLRARENVSTSTKRQSILFTIFAIFALLLPWWLRGIYGDIMAAASLISGMMFLMIYAVSINMISKKKKITEPKLLIDTSKKNKAPFIDATGAHAGALFGDVRHDPFQSGGLGTPA